MTGIFDASSCWYIFFIELERPPGVSSSTTAASYPSRAALVSWWSNQSCVTGLISRSGPNRMASTRGCADEAVAPVASTAAKSETRARAQASRPVTGVRILSGAGLLSLPQKVGSANLGLALDAQ